ncbi:MAG: RsmE family RNA methyltransferase [Phycisphaerae bacterium]
MALHRFYCASLDPGVVELDPTESRHALTSLRLRPGDPLILIDGRGGVAEARVIAAPGAARGKRAAVAQIERRRQIAPPRRTIRLVVAGCKGARLDFLVEKCTELGVGEIAFCEFERSVVVPGVGHVEKLRRTAMEACKQSGRAWFPTILGARKLADCVMSVGRAGRGGILAADPDPHAPWIGEWLATNGAGYAELACVVGPEGGLTDNERDLLRREPSNWVRLNSNILRVETAAIAAAASLAAWVHE